MNKINDGGPVFPVLDESHFQPGMSLRQYAAIHATIAEQFEPSVKEAEKFMGEKCPDQTDDFVGWVKFWCVWEARIKLLKADAMIAESAKGI